MGNMDRSTGEVCASDTREAIGLSVVMPLL